jgi:hypothetical protein
MKACSKRVSIVILDFSAMIRRSLMGTNLAPAAGCPLRAHWNDRARDPRKRK